MAGSGLIIYKHAVLILSAPFMSPLSEKVENHLLGIEQPMHFSIPQMISDLARGLQIAMRNIIRELFYLFLLKAIIIFNNSRKILGPIQSDIYSQDKTLCAIFYGLMYFFDELNFWCPPSRCRPI